MSKISMGDKSKINKAIIPSGTTAKYAGIFETTQVNNFQNVGEILQFNDDETVTDLVQNMANVEDGITKAQVDTNLVIKKVLANMYSFNTVKEQTLTEEVYADCHFIYNFIW